LPAAKSRNPSTNAEGRIVEGALCLHLFEERIGMASRNEPCSMESALACTASATSRASPVVDCQRKNLCVGFLRDGIKETGIQTIEDAAGGAGFQNGFDAVDAIGLQSVHLLAGFFGSLRDAIELFSGGSRARPSGT